jgi:hypothetical protein
MYYSILLIPRASQIDRGHIIDGARLILRCAHADYNTTTVQSTTLLRPVLQQYGRLATMTDYTYNTTYDGGM